MTLEKSNTQRTDRDETANVASEPTNYIAEAITEAFGERCPEYVEGCPCCEAWKQYDALSAPTLPADVKGE